MFPYSAIIAANLLNKKGGQRQVNQPKIDTLNEYTLLAPEQFYNILTARAREVGICEMADMISNWQNFDSLSDVKKRLFLNEYAPLDCLKDKPTIVERIKDYFKSL